MRIHCFSGRSTVQRYNPLQLYNTAHRSAQQQPPRESQKSRKEAEKIVLLLMVTFFFKSCLFYRQDFGFKTN